MYCDSADLCLVLVPVDDGIGIQLCPQCRRAPTQEPRLNASPTDSCGNNNDNQNQTMMIIGHCVTWGVGQLQGLGSGQARAALRVRAAKRWAGVDLVGTLKLVGRNHGRGMGFQVAGMGNWTIAVFGGFLRGGGCEGTRSKFAARQAIVHT